MLTEGLGTLLRPLRRRGAASASFPDSLGADFARRWRWLQRTRRWSTRRMRAYQGRALRALIRMACEHTDFYGRWFAEAGADPRAVAAPEDLEQLPILTKAQLAGHGREMVNCALDPAGLELISTGGSTGMPTALWRRPGPDMRGDWAFLYRQWHEAGWRWGRPVLRIRGLNPDENATPGELTRRHRADENSLTLSSFELSAEKLAAFVRAMEEFQPEFLDIYPSALRLLGGMMLDRGLRARPVKACFCESEIVGPAEREIARRVWGCEIFAGYGNSERCVDAVECAAHAGYHVNQEYGIVELVDEAGRVIREPKVEGDIVATGLLTTTMPIIRFNTEDRACWLSGPCPCGRPGPRLGEIAGRRQDCLVADDGRLISMAALNHFTAMDTIRQFRFYQDAPGRARLDYLCGEGREIDAAALRAELAAKTAGGLSFELRRVDGFKLSPRGKHRMVDQRLNLCHVTNARPTSATTAAAAGDTGQGGAA